MQNIHVYTDQPVHLHRLISVCIFYVILNAFFHFTQAGQSICMLHKWRLYNSAMTF